MNTISRLSCAIAVAATTIGGALAADKTPYYIVNAQGGKVYGDKLTADKDGNLQLQIAGGAGSQVFKAGTYKYAVTPKPPEVKKLEDGKPEEVLALSTAVYNAYRYLGWGGHTCYLEGMAKLDKDPAAAMQSFDRGVACRDENATDELRKGKIMALIKLKKNTEATTELDKLVLANDERTAAFAFNARAQLYLEENPPNKKDAVVQYLKTFMVFKAGGAADKERAEAKRNLVKLLKELGDQRAADFEKMP